MIPTIMCSAGLTLRLRYHVAPPGWEKDAARFEYSLHLANCQECREYIDAQAEAAKNAVHPELTTKQIEEME